MRLPGNVHGLPSRARTLAPVRSGRDAAPASGMQTGGGAGWWILDKTSRPARVHRRSCWRGRVPGPDVDRREIKSKPIPRRSPHTARTSGGLDRLTDRSRSGDCPVSLSRLVASQVPPPVPWLLVRERRGAVAARPAPSRLMADRAESGRPHPAPSGSLQRPGGPHLPAKG